MKTEERERKLEDFFQKEIEKADEKLNFYLSDEFKKARHHFRLGQFDQAVEHLKQVKTLIWA